MTDAAKETLEQRVAETLDWLEQVPTSAIERDAAQTIRSLLAEVERLRAGRGGDGDSCPICSTKQARIDAALALYESAMEIPPLAEKMADALKGED